LAQAVIEWSDWVIRRVEKVRFRDDRSVNRQISVDFVVRPDAPVFRAQGGDHRNFWLVPVSIMRRKTLVNFDLHDEAGNSLPLPGIRLAQYLDESMLHAVARSELGEPLAEDTAKFIHEAIAGPLTDVQKRVEDYEQGTTLAGPAQIQTLRRSRGCSMRCSAASAITSSCTHSWKSAKAGGTASSTCRPTNPSPCTTGNRACPPPKSS
jgi:hypothetical protein